ncbi:hypothetical protein ATANTOWER_026787 [Ataeniobius toweri]|uniref:Transposase n=1 Tax=Ataeniobius toweri TaxID=208326 RepID=A0ABU7B4G6_9TELE|nr:hypothetical protein [Ataeniobius toweri]
MRWKSKTANPPTHHPHSETWWQHHNVGMPVLSRIKMLVRIYVRLKRRRKAVKCLRLRWTFTYQQDNDPKHTATATMEWFRIHVLEQLNQTPDLNQWRICGNT